MVKFKLVFLDIEGNSVMYEIIDMSKIISVIREYDKLGLLFKIYIVLNIRIF